MQRVVLRKRRRRVGGGVNPFDPAVAALAHEPAEDDRFLRWTVTAAVLVHLVLLAVTFPDWRKTRTVSLQQPKVFVVQQVKFKAPPPQQAREIPQRRARKIPVPDPTPDDPEPIVDMSKLAEVDLALPPSDAVFSIPDAPPGLATSGPLQVTGNVSPPIKIVAPQPLFTEDARRARLEGVIILQTVVDDLGDVSNIKVLKGLPLGLTESAVDTVAEWKFEPATLGGEPVSVYYMLTITFRIQ